MKIVVLEAVGLHLGFLGCYGNDWVATPTLDSLACEAVVFDHHFTDCPDPGRRSGARTGSHAFREPVPPRDDIANVLRDRGWTTQVVAPGREAAFSRVVQPAFDAWRRDTSALLWIDGPDLTPPWSLPGNLLSVYFEDPEEDEPRAEEEDADDDEDDDEPDELEPREDEAEEPAEPWPDPPQGRVGPMPVADFRRLGRTYAAVVTYFDAELDRVCRAIVDGGWAEETLLVVTAHCGLSLGEHGIIGLTGSRMHEEIAHVPLLVRLPNEQHAGRRIAALTQPADLWASLMDRALAQHPEGDGHSLLPLLTGQAEALRPAAVTAWAGRTGGAALRTRDWALVMPSSGPDAAGLFVKPDDRWEMNDLRLKHFELAEELEADLKRSL